MKTLNLKIMIDDEVMENTEMTKEQIENVVMNQSFSNFTIDEYTIVTLDNREQIKLLPYFTAFNDFCISVTYF